MQIKKILNNILILLLFVAIPFFGFILRMTAEEGSDIYSKIFKILVALICIFTVALIKIYLPLVIDKFLARYIILLLIFFIPYIAHFFLSKSFDENLNTFALNELIIFLYLIIVFVIAALIDFSYKGFYLVIAVMNIFGIVLGVLTFWFSITFMPERLLDRFVGEFIRAGTEVTDPNLLAAILNIFSLASIGSFIISKSLIIKSFSLLSFLTSQAGRTLTFSNGALLSIIISLFILVVLLDRKNRKKIIILTTIIVTTFLIVVYVFDLFDIIFYRLMLSDESVKQSSVYSRVDQYISFWKLINENPYVLLYGVGSARLPDLLGLPVTLHNSFLRPLAVGGILSFIGYIGLCWLTYKNFKYSLKHCNDEKLKVIIIVLFSGFIGWLFQSLTVPFDASGVNLFFWSIAYSIKRTVKGGTK